MKPILFNAEMVRAIQNGNKTVTRRVVKPQPLWKNAPIQQKGYPEYWANWDDERIYKAPYRPGDILYVPQPWKCYAIWDVMGYEVEFQDGEYTKFEFTDQKRAQKWAKYLDKPANQWQSPYFMPREAARIFLEVADVRVERLQEITELDILEKEGVTVDFSQPKPSYISLAYTETRLKPAARKAFADLWNACYAKSKPVKVKGVIDHYESYPWEDIQEARTYRGKPWYVIGNPWTWGIELERCEKPEEE